MAPEDSTDPLEKQISQRVGMRLRELRRAAGITATDLAARAGISQSQVSKIENGRATLSIRMLARLCQVFDRPVGYLFQNREDTPRLLGTLNTVKGPENGAIQWFADQVRQMTGNHLSLIALRPSQIGSAAAQVDQLQEGLIDLFIEELFYYGKFVRGFGVFALPYAFRSEETRQSFLKGRFFNDRLREPLRCAGIRLINRRWNWLRGVEWVLASRQPMVSPAELRGLRVRVIEDPLLRRFWEGMGAVPVPVPWSDVRAALKAGEIDVLPTHKAHLYPLGFCRYAPFVTLLGDLPPVLGTAINESKYQVLPPDIQQGLGQTCDQGGDFFSRHVHQAEVQNEPLNIRRHKAAYLKVCLEPWKREVERIRSELLSEGLLDADTATAVAEAEHDSKREENCEQEMDHPDPGRVHP
ncbi:MAG: helix-turn-helix domain-containing protein [Desulfobacteraceae bacterium]|nr:MAG: helix-turn-helix domain-containing protein [Desulfobacteraceae bacterium]